MFEQESHVTLHSSYTCTFRPSSIDPYRHFMNMNAFYY